MVHTQLGQQRPWLGQDDGREVLCTLYVCGQAVYYEPVNPSYSNLNFRLSVKFPTLARPSQSAHSAYKDVYAQVATYADLLCIHGCSLFS